MALKHDSHLRVRYAETDQMGIAHHAAYILWLEVARTELLRDLGMRYRDLEREGVTTSVIDLRMRYRAPAYYDEKLTIRCWLSDIKRFKLEFAYEIFDESQKLLTQALVCLGSLTKEGKPKVLPKDLTDRLIPYLDRSTRKFI